MNDKKDVIKQIKSALKTPVNSEFIYKEGDSIVKVVISVIQPEIMEAADGSKWQRIYPL